MFLHFFAKNASATAAMVACVLCGLLTVATPVAAQVQTAVEYGFYSYWDDCYYYGTNNGRTLVCDYGSYFVTSSPDEMAALDGGAFDLFGGQFAWQRTGETFDVWSGPESGALPTCRFFKQAFYPEHVYTPYEAECAAVPANPDWQYKYEGIAFYLQIPDENGNCPFGTTILYRLYNNGIDGAPVHRLTTRPSTFNQMLATGWVFEGDSRTFAFACVPSSTTPSIP